MESLLQKWSRVSCPCVCLCKQQEHIIQINQKGGDNISGRRARHIEWLHAVSSTANRMARSVCVIFLVVCGGASREPRETYLFYSEREQTGHVKISGSCSQYLFHDHNLTGRRWLLIQTIKAEHQSPTGPGLERGTLSWYLGRAPTARR